LLEMRQMRLAVHCFCGKVHRRRRILHHLNRDQVLNRILRREECCAVKRCGLK
jgi:hypothetical protein